MNTNESKTGDILIVDDTPDNLRFLSELLTKAGYTVRKVTQGKMGIEAALLKPPDLILLDIRMPDMDGYRVCDRLKSSDRTRQIPVIFLSALDEEAEKVMAFHAGGVDYILKPFQVVEVLARIETHLRMSRLQQQLQQKNAQLEQEIAQRNSAEAALQTLNQGFEAQIQERTTQLQLENQQLREQQTKLQQALTLKLQQINTVVQQCRSPILATTSAIESLRQEELEQEVDRHLQTLTTSTTSIDQLLRELLILTEADSLFRNRESDANLNS
ncbi:MAG: hypothetical protein Kow00121_14390 [Elainellaceae cyanobacterium]